ncbi:hypothetical protein EWM64_g3978 [Hericium alpestre]|uniref:ABM domain-containing protein n=1 Tax=Hericium alpestre TaxID=135208 RepID=A0A4Z0A0Q4_9AGAM|nr:hypothetical protein EWM64_g3978 [Hericium alpestre]
MPVTEFATLELIAPFKVHHSDVLPIFRTLSKRQAAWSGYPLYFYQNTAKPSEIYLISGWKDVPAHYEWIASQGNQELLTMFKPYLDVKDLVHLDLDFREIKKGVGYLEVEVTREEANADEGESCGPDMVWNGSGKDAEGKRDGIWLESARTRRAQI